MKISMSYIPHKDRRPLLAWWLLPSFSRVQYTDMDMVMFIGAHKARGSGTKDMDEIRRDPDAYKPKINVTIYTFHNKGESFPVEAGKMASIVAGINVLNGAAMHGSALYNMVNAIILTWKCRTDLPAKPYSEFDPKKESFQIISSMADKYGHPMMRYNDVDPVKREPDIKWMNGAIVKMGRPSRDKHNTFYTDAMVLGKDALRDEIVLCMRKTVGSYNYIRFIPLYRRVALFIASIYYLMQYKPSKYPIITVAAFERLVQQYIDRMVAHREKLVSMSMASRIGDIIKALDVKDGI